MSYNPWYTVKKKPASLFLDLCLVLNPLYAYSWLSQCSLCSQVKNFYLASCTASYSLCLHSCQMFLILIIFFAKLCDFWDSSRNSECNLLILRCYGKMLLSFWNVHEAKFLQEVTDNRRGSIRLTAIEGGWNDNKEILLKSVMFKKLLIPNTYTIFETT